MKIRQVGAEPLHADGRINRLDEDNGRFSQLCVRATMYTSVRLIVMLYPSSF